MLNVEDKCFSPANTGQKGALCPLSERVTLGGQFEEFRGLEGAAVEQALLRLARRADR